ncbi:AraC family transcriptional regulator [Paenibacillus cremeus]|uniref:AraC family transcriptional regulator n=1 Tax=Paenibacillus cremeus TaxID=2163881 RepID=A0A559K333_9BACL|nr:AraC family transcriptional regulator [Paenibacillus cremeus]TVY06555.1 AraC family transcriptional regulator [Paenibacillus cremeus]
MKNTWLNRLLLSYIPIFLIVFSVLVFLFVLVLSEQAKRQAVSTNRIIAEQISQSVDNSLRSISDQIVKELRSNETVRDFYKMPNDALVNQKASAILNNIVLSNELIDQVYLYRTEDNRVISNSTMMGIDAFVDRVFITEQLKKEYDRNWTSIRFVKSENDQMKPVISLVRKYPLLFEDQGLIVVNVNPLLLQKEIDGMVDAKSFYTNLLDRSGRLFYDKTTQFANVAEMPDSKLTSLSAVTSAYTGFEVRVGYRNSIYNHFLSGFSVAWVVLVLLLLAFGLLSVFYVSKRHYKPIEMILKRISEQTSPLPAAGKKLDEFRIIADTLDQLQEQTSEYQRQHGEHLVLQKHVFFQELLEGNRRFSEDEWKEAMRRFGIVSDSMEAIPVVLEIDRYAEFQRSFTQRDQQLYKFIIGSVLKELGENAGLSVLCEWVSNHRMGLLLMGNDISSFTVDEICRKSQHWHLEHLPFTVSFSLGPAADSADEIYRSFSDAAEALRYKPGYGTNAIIYAENQPVRGHTDVYPLLKTVRALAQAYRLNNSEWTALLDSIFEELKAGQFAREDIVHLLTFLLFHLHREMSELSAEVLQIWNRGAGQALQRAIDDLETIDSCYLWFRSELQKTSEDIIQSRERRPHVKVVTEIRTFIEENFADSNLSLDSISERFGLNPKTLSRIFKEETGEKFVDFLIKLRMEHASSLIVHTDVPIQDISMQVGYSNPISFLRVFKKYTGVTPGIYRKDAALEEAP